MTIEQKIRQSNSNIGLVFSITEFSRGTYRVEYPLYFADGDSVGIYINELPDGRIYMCDKGTLLMRLSFTRDLSEDDYSEIRKLISPRQLLSSTGSLYAFFTIDKFNDELVSFGESMIKISNHF